MLVPAPDVFGLACACSWLQPCLRLPLTGCRLNRDTWTHESLRELVKGTFMFYQKDSRWGISDCTYRMAMHATTLAE